MLRGTHIRLEPLEYRHVEGLVAASATDSSLYHWSPVPQGKVEATSYVDTALASRDAGNAVSFAIISLDDRVDEPGFYARIATMILSSRAQRGPPIPGKHFRASRGPSLRFGMTRLLCMVRYASLRADV